MSNICMLIMGPSGSGKTTLATILHDDYGYKILDSYTTRPPRYEGERGHIFVDDERFPAEDEQVAFTEYDGYRYCATQRQIDEADFYVVDPKGAQLLLENYGGRKELITLLLNVPYDECKRRMLARGDSGDQVRRRQRIDSSAFSNITSDLKLVNLDVDETVEMVWRLFDSIDKYVAYEGWQEE